MGKNKGAPKGESVAKANVPITMSIDNHTSSKSNATSPAAANAIATVGAGANISTTPSNAGANTLAMKANAGREPENRRHGLPAPTHSIPGLDYETGDVQVMVAGTHVFRLHQEILARHSTFFSEQLQISKDANGLVVAPRSGDIPVVVLRDIRVETFVNVLCLILPLPNAIRQQKFTPSEAEQLLQTSSMLGIAGVCDFAMDILSTAPGATALTTYNLSHQFSLPHWKVKSIQELVYRIRPLTDHEAQVIGALATAQIARLRELFRSRIFARFEPVTKPERDGVDTQPHQAGRDSEQLWRTAGKNRGLGRCQQAMLDALKLVFDVDGLQSEPMRQIFQGEASVTTSLKDYLRSGPVEGGVPLCKGCLDSVGKVVEIYCKKEEMDETIEQEVNGGGKLHR